jgi:hypothetical protein
LAAAASVAVLLSGTLLSACSDDRPGGGASATTATVAPSTTGTTAPGEAPTPRGSTGEALQALLGAEQRSDHATSYRLLDDAGRKEFPDVAEWSRRRAQLPAITGFSIESESAAEVVAIVQHQPGLDPFTGLSAARERQTWTASRSDGGFLLAAEPEVEYLLPPDEAATGTVLEWARAVQACDPAAAGRVEAVQPLYGSSTGATQLCGSTAALTTGEVAPLDGGPRSADLVAQYSTDALAWARVVPLRGLEPEVQVVVAPIGESWRVVALYD